MNMSTEEVGGRKVGVMGGTFNPIHMGHLLLAEWAMEKAGLDQILFIPTGNPYMKDNCHVLSGEIRIQMTALAIADHPDFKVSGMEVERKGHTYTCDTMEQLKKKSPKDEFYFIMGADCLHTIEKWRDPQRIFEFCSVIAAARNGSSLQQMEEKCKELSRKFHGNIFLLQFPAMEISSTDIRERVACGRSIRYLVPEKVRDYIISNRLYQEENHEKCKCQKNQEGDGEGTGSQAF